MQFFSQLLKQVRAIYQGMNGPRRIAFGALALACLGLIAGVSWYSVQTDYRVLYSGLSPEDAGAVTAKLQSQGVTYRLSAGGGTIAVPAEQLQQLRLDLALEGLPSKGKGFELFDELNIGMTPFQQQVNYNRALQAELARTIMQVEPVAFARVHLVRPEPTPFVREQKPATASIVLKLRPGSTLNRTTAAGIAALVSRSVEGLTADNVTLLDTNGHVLFDPHVGESGGATMASQMDYRKDLESYLSNRAEEMLAQVLGPGRAVVRVTADVNLQRQKTKRESYDPDQRVLVRETVTNRRANAATAGGRGVAGTGSNLASANRNSSAATVPGGSNENEENTDSEWRATKIEQELDEGRNTVERLTVAALVDLSHAADGQQALTVAQTEQIIKEAVGFKEKRDEIKINDVHLASGSTLDNVEAEYLQNQRWQWYLNLAKYISTGVGALVVLVVALLVYRRLASTRATAASPMVEAGATALLIQLAQENPERIARALESWIDEAEQRTNVAA